MTADEFNAMQAGMKPSKYRNVKTVVDGITFDSKAEAKRYGELRLMLDAGEIEDLTMQPRYQLDVNGVKVCSYVGDFLYRDVARDRWILEDVKGVKTPAYRLKRKLMIAVHGIEVVEVSRQ